MSELPLSEMLLLFVFGLFALVGGASIVLLTWEAWQKKHPLGVFLGLFLLTFSVLFVTL